MPAPTLQQQLDRKRGAIMGTLRDALGEAGADLAPPGRDERYRLLGVRKYLERALRQLERAEALL